MGYGEFARYFIYLMHKFGLNLATKDLGIQRNPLDYGNKGTLAEILKKPCHNPDVNIVNMIPSLFTANRIPNAKNIGFTMFEADKIPRDWVSHCNVMDEIWVPSKHNREVFARSGVTVPIHIVTPGVDESELPEPQLNSGDFRFYSIFQWMERKNPSALLRAFCTAFEGKTDATLTIKTYHQTGNDKSYIQEQVKGILSGIKLRQLPKIQIITDFLSHERMNSLHRNSDCYLSLSHAEGWSLPAWTAAVNGRYVIHTKYSSVVDFLGSDYSGLIEYSMSPIYGMSGFVPFYDSSMMWAEPHLDHAIYAMRWAYENRADSFNYACKKRKDILNQFSEQNTINTIKGLL